jgi:hypothetical protein
MVTLWSQCLKVGVNDEPAIIAKKVKEAKEQDFDNLAVVDDGALLGYVAVGNLKIAQIKRSLIQPFQGHTIGSSELLPRVVERIMMKGVEPCRLYFVLDEHAKPIGIMTYADLNRKTSYIYTYTLILFLEQWLKKRIVEKFHVRGQKQDDSWITTLEHMKGIGGKSAKELLKDKATNGGTPLSWANLEHLVHVFTNDKLLQEDFRRVRGLCPDAAYLRPRVAHPVKLLISRSRAREDIRRLKRFWTRMEPFVRVNDFNEKNRGWPVES